jgi:ankyrin repeat protein
MRLECFRFSVHALSPVVALASLLVCGDVLAQATPAATPPVPKEKGSGATSASDTSAKPGARKDTRLSATSKSEKRPGGELQNMTEEEFLKAAAEAAAAKQAQAQDGAKPAPAVPDRGNPSLDASARPSQAAASVPEGPQVVEFDPPIAELGEMIAGVAKSMTVKIKNVSDQPIRITKAIPGCGCTTPIWPKDPIAPGASADCEITMRPGDKAGVHMNKKVTFNIENHPPAVLTVTGDVVAFVTMSPDMIEQPADLVGAAPTEITLESTDGTAFKVTEIAPPVVKDPPTEAATKHVLRLDWGMWEETGRQMRLVVKTDHPKAPQLATLVRRAVNSPGANAPTPPSGPRPMAGPGTTDLITAVRTNDLSKIKALIDGGANVNEQDRAGSRTALHWAAKNGNREALAALVDAKADPNIKDRQGRTPLWGAVENSPEVTKYLIEKGADVNARDTVNATPLLWAAGFGRPETVSLLLENKADVKAVDDNGWTALIWAAGIGQPQTVDLLVKAGADLKAADRQTGDTPLLRAARTGKPESVKVLLAAGADIAARNNLQQTALHCAAQSGSAEKVALLLAAKADPAAVDNRNFTALDHAMNRTTGDKAKLIEILKPVSPESKAAAPAAPAAPAANKAE